MNDDTEEGGTPEGTNRSNARTVAYFMSVGGSLSKWRREGILDRESLLLRSFVENGLAERVLVFTYGHEDDEPLATLRSRHPAFASVELVPPAWGGGGRLGHLLHSFLGPVARRSALREAEIMRTNQVSGAWAAAIAARGGRAAFVFRMGYILSRRYAKNGQRLRSFVMRMIENRLLSRADAVIVTSENARDAMRSRAPARTPVTRVPTYVDMSVFRPKTEFDFDGPIVYVGRVTDQKNLSSLVEACAAIGLPLHIYGVGPDGDMLMERAAACGADVELKGLLDNTELATRLQDYAIFVLPSFHEGLPKVMIEAMAVGLVCVGSTIPGITDMIRDGENGYLIDGFTADDIAEALRRARSERDPTMGARARQTVERMFGIDAHIEAERAVHHEALRRAGKR